MYLCVWRKQRVMFSLFLRYLFDQSKGKVTNYSSVATINDNPLPQTVGVLIHHLNKQRRFDARMSETCCCIGIDEYSELLMVMPEV